MVLSGLACWHDAMLLLAAWLGAAGSFLGSGIFSLGIVRFVCQQITIGGLKLNCARHMARLGAP